MPNPFPPCPQCGRKGLHYANHPRAFGRKNFKSLNCRFCSANFLTSAVVAETKTENTRLTLEFKAATDHFERALDQLSQALWNLRADVPGGLVSTACFHLRTMRLGIYRLLLDGKISAEEAAACLGLTVEETLLFVSSGQAARQLAEFDQEAKS